MTRPPVTARNRLSAMLLTASRTVFAVFFLTMTFSTSWEDAPVLAPALLTVTWRVVPLRVPWFVLVPVLLAGCWLVARLLEHPRRRLSLGDARVTAPLAGLGVLALVRAWPVHQPRVALVTLGGILLIWGVTFFTINDLPRAWATAILAVYMGGQGLVACMQFIGQGPVGLTWLREIAPLPTAQGASVIEAAGQRWLRAYGLTPHPNNLGGYLGISLLVCGAAALSRRSLRPWQRRVLWGVVGLGVLAWFFTFSRSAWLGTILGAVYVVMVTRLWERVDWRSRHVRRALGVAAIVGLGIAVLGGMTVGDLVVARLFGGSELEARSIDERVRDLKQAWSLIRVAPLKGVGAGYYVDALWASVVGEPPPAFQKVHNIPVLIAAEMGVVGPALWLWFLAAPVLVVWRRSRREAVEVSLAGWTAAFVLVFVVSFLDCYLYFPATWWPALFLGLVTGSWVRSIAVKTPERLADAALS